MNCRRIVNGNVVWFGKAGKDANDNFIKVDSNYSSKSQAVIDSLTQRLSVLEHELWYNITYGVPIQNKLKSKAIIDANVLQIVNQHEDVLQVQSFSSQIDASSKTYKCKMTIQSKYGLIDLSI